MGKKSDKKVKSERVNALRKQYDAFLEEDKKRKERNEYILGRLDNMRYSATAVQMRHKPIVYGDVMPVFNRGGCQSEQFERRQMNAHTEPSTRPDQNLQLDVSRNYLDNTSLLKEISKKYILIPKLRSSLVDNYIGTIPPQSLPPIAVSSPQNTVHNNEDWKSKYDILDQLKSKEKEEHTEKYTNDELYPVKEKQASCKDDTILSNNLTPKQNTDESKILQKEGYALRNYNIKDITEQYEQYIAEQALEKGESDAQAEKQKSQVKKQNPVLEKTQDSSGSDLKKLNSNTVPQSYILQNQYVENHEAVEESHPITSNIEQNKYEENHLIQNVQSGYINNEVSNNSELQMKDMPQQEEYPVMYEQPIEVEGKYPDPNNVYLDPEDYSPIQVGEPSASFEEIQNEPTIENSNVNEEAVVQYPVEMLNVQEFTPKDDVQLIDGENVNPVYYASENTGKVDENNPQATVQETYDPQDNSGIEAFDAEQREMFYSEETSEHVYEQQQNNAYNEEYANAAPAQTQEYSYYENPATTMQEQEYPVEINENEESSAPYDQNYEQQYAPEYSQDYQGQEQQQYVQNEGYDQTEQSYDQQYVQPEGYEQTEQQQYVQQEGYDPAQQYQDYQYQQVNPETAQNVEQVLDNEAGYVEHHSVDETKQEEQPPVAAAQASQKTA